MPMRSALRMRFAYGQVTPWVHKVGDRTVAVAGPDSVWLDTEADTYGKDLTTYSEFTVAPGDRVAFTISWEPSHKPQPALPDPEGVARPRPRTSGAEWVGAVHVHRPLPRGGGPLADHPQGAHLRARPAGSSPRRRHRCPRTSAASRNWDYRFTWLRDAAITLSSLLRTGYREEAARLARVAAARGRGRPGEPADHVRHRRRARAAARTSCTGCPATRTPPRSGSATAPRTSCSSTSTARSPRRCTSAT